MSIHLFRLLYSELPPVNTSDCLLMVLLDQLIFLLGSIPNFDVPKSFLTKDGCRLESGMAKPVCPC